VSIKRADASPAGERRAFAVIGVLSVAALGFLFWLLYLRPAAEDAPAWTDSLPAVNALLNFTSGAFLVAGVLAIRAKRRDLHMKLVLAAVSVSGAFLVSYIVYHHFHGDTPFTGQGFVRPVYFFILITHILGSMVALPLVLVTLFLAATERFARHRRFARVTFPLWLYVSVTGVLVFLFLRSLH
jgi:putative membrane protein